MGMYVGGEIADLARHRAAVDRRRDRGPGGPPRRGSARSRRSSGRRASCSRRCRRRDGDPERRRPIVARMDRADERAAIRYGFSPTADVRADRVGLARASRDALHGCGSPGGRARGRRSRRSGRCRSTTRWPAAAVGVAAGVRLADIVRGLARRLVGAAPGRARPPARRDRSSTIRYNASPGSVARRSTCSPGCPGRQVAVLGEMLELGRRARGRPSRRSGRPPRPSSICSSSSGRARAASSPAPPTAGLEPAEIHRRARIADDALEALRPRMRDGDVVLVKASRGIGARSARGRSSALELGEGVRP